MTIVTNFNTNKERLERPSKKRCLRYVGTEVLVICMTHLYRLGYIALKKGYPLKEKRFIRL